MTTTVDAGHAGSAVRGTHQARDRGRSCNWKTPIALAVFVVIAFLMSAVAGREGTASFRLNTDADLIQLLLVALLTWAIFAVAGSRSSALGVVSWWLVRIKRLRPVWLAALIAYLIVIAVLPSIVVVPGRVTPIVDRAARPHCGVLILAGVAGQEDRLLAHRALRGALPARVPHLRRLGRLARGPGARASWSARLGSSAPLIFGALGGALSERVGVVNVAIRGSAAGRGVLVRRSWPLGVPEHQQLRAQHGRGRRGSGPPCCGHDRGPDRAHPGADLRVCWSGWCSAAFSIQYVVDQVIVGVVLNVLVLGLTNFLFTQVLAPNARGAESATAVPEAQHPAASARYRSSGPCCSGRRSSST